MLFRTLEPFYMEWMKLITRSISSVAQPVAHDYYIPNASLPQWKMPIEMKPLSHQDFLFNRRDDPAQNDNLWDSGSAAERQRMVDAMVDLLKQEGCPPEQFARLGLPTDGGHGPDHG
jgi:hypothetical protein